MIPHLDGETIILEPRVGEPDDYAKRLAHWSHAFDEYHAHRNDLGTALLAPFKERLDEAEAEWVEALTTTLSIAEAEKLHARLGKAILDAKVWRGDFTYHREDDDA